LGFYFWRKKMHEWSIAESVISAVIEEAKKERLEEITEVRIRIGELQRMEDEIFMFALDELRKGVGLLKNVKIEVETEGVLFGCRMCGNEWKGMDLNEDEYEAIHFCPEVSHAYIRCPSCGSPDFEIMKGRGVIISSIKGKRDDDGSETEHC